MILTLVQNVSIHAYVSKEGKINLQTTRFFRFYQILSIKLKLLDKFAAPAPGRVS